MDNGPVGASLAFFTMQRLEADGLFYLYGGLDSRGWVRGLLWAVEIDGDIGASWNLRSLDGPLRMQHCSCPVGTRVFVWGGVTGLESTRAFTVLCTAVTHVHRAFHINTGHAFSPMPPHVSQIRELRLKTCGPSTPVRSLARKYGKSGRDPPRRLPRRPSAAWQQRQHRESSCLEANETA